MYDLKKVEISYGLNIHKSDVQNTTLFNALQSIKTGGKNGSFVSTIERIRTSTDKKERDSLKATLPYFVYSGLFEKVRDEKSLITHSKVVCIEWDDVENYEELKQSLKHDNYILAVFLSPSNGVKALVKIEDGDKHAEHYNALISRFNSYGKLDTTSRNISRVQYISYDPDIYINENSFVFADVLQEKTEVTSTSNGVGVFENQDYSKLNIATKMIAHAEDGEKHITLVKASYLLGGYVKTGLLNEEVATLALDVAIENKPNVENIQAAKKAIRDSLKAGMNMPIYEFDRLEKEITKEFSLGGYSDSFESKDDIIIAVNKMASGYVTPTFSSGWEHLDEHWVWKPNRLITNLAHDGVGKTSVALYMMLAASVNHGWKFMIYASENENEALFIDMMQWLIGKYINNSNNRRQEWVMNKSEMNFALDFIHEHFKFIKNNKPFTPEELLELTSKELSRKKYNYIMIDPFNSLINKSKQSDNAYITNTTTMFEQYSKTECGLWINLHSRTDARKEKDADGFLKAPEKNQAEYGTMWANKSHSFVVTHRNPDDRERWMDTDFIVKKEKTTQTGGKAHFKGDAFTITMNYLRFIDSFGNTPFENPYDKLNRPS